jgi:hypothetical protein
MAKVGRKEIEVTQEMQSEAERLSALGFNERQISEALGLSYGSFQDKKQYFYEFLKKGRQSLRERITSAMVSRIDEADSTMLIFSAKRLGLFNPSLETKEPTNTAEAIAELLRIYSSVASGEISAEQGDKLVGILQNYLKAYELSELERRVSLIEERTNEKS